MRIYHIIDIEKTLTLILNARPYTVFPSHSRYMDIVNMLDTNEPDVEKILEWVDPKIAIQKFIGSDIEIHGAEVFFNGEPVHNVVVDRIIAFNEQKLPVEPLVRFLQNLLQNPSYRAREQLYRFLEHNKMPITSDGCFMAYKAVRKDGLDHHSQTIMHTIGEPIIMPRHLVNDDPNITCSSGLHCCAWSYIPSYYGSGRILLMKVNPRDVVSVPTDYNNAKMRVCEYVPVEEVTKAEAENHFGTRALYDVETDYEVEEFDDFDD